MIVFLDSGVLGILANPNKIGEASDCEQWLLSLLSKGVSILTSDIGLWTKKRLICVNNTQITFQFNFVQLVWHLTEKCYSSFNPSVSAEGSGSVSPPKQTSK